MGSRESLFLLIRLALDNEKDLGDSAKSLSLLSADDWKEVVDLSFRQGVAAIAVDGLQKLYDSVPDLELAIDTPELEELKYEWFSSVISEEENYSKISVVAKQISAYLKAAGLSALLVKGLSYASYYPIPKHRSFGDIDIFSPYSYNEIDDILKPISENFNLDYYRHSHCTVSDITIENHKHLCDVRGQKRWTALEKELSNYADEILSVKNEGGLHFPDNRLSVLFFLYHAQSHLIFESLNLRFLTDWAVILYNEQKLMSSSWFDESLKRFGLERIANVLTSLCVRHLKISQEYLAPYLVELIAVKNEKLEVKVLSDIFRNDKEGFGNSSFCSRVTRSIIMFDRGWKFREFLGVSPIAFVSEKWFGIVKEKMMKLKNRINFVSSNG